MTPPRGEESGMLMNDKNESDERIAVMLRDSQQLTETINRALREAVAQHFRANHPIADWRDNSVVWLASSAAPHASQMHGQFRDDPTFDGFLSEVAAARRAADEERET